MILKKINSPIYLLLLTLLLVLSSCKKEPQKIKQQPKTKSQYTKYITLAEEHFYNQKYDSAFYYYTKIKNTSDPAKDQDRIIYALMQSSYIQYLLGDYSSCETSATEALPLFQKTTDLTYKISLYNILGQNYRKLLDYDNSLYYYTKALKLTEDPAQKTPLLNNIAVVYLNKKKYSEVLKILVPLSKNTEIQKNKENYAAILDNIGNTFLILKDPRSLFYLNLSLKTHKQTKGELGIANIYILLSKYYKTTNPRLAYKYAELAYKKATEINSVDLRLDSLALLIENSVGNSTKKFSLLHLQISDSIFSVRQKARNTFAKIKYDSRIDKEENLKLKANKIKNELQIEQQKNRNQLLYFLIALGITITGFSSNYLIAKNKKDKIKTSYDTEIRIAKKLHDELANDVFQTMAFAETQDLSTHQNKDIILNNLYGIYSRTRNISNENNSIAIGSEFINGFKEMISGFNSTEINVLVNGMDLIEWIKLESNKKIVVYRVVQELLVNMRKHSKCSLAVLSFKNNKNNLQIDYSDNGVGASIGKQNLKNGLLNVENRIIAVKGSITFDNNSTKGFKTSFSIPL
jgi:tetratricopeptide (TPR) repeat protein